VIAYLSGTVLQKFTKSLVLKIDSIGYEVTVSAPLFEKTSAGEKMELFIYTHVREDELSLYGFEKPEELRFFKQMLQVPGIGPKLGTDIMALPLEKIKGAILHKDIATLKSISGVGGKIAERLVTEMKNKIELLESQVYETTEEKEENEDAITALLSLGYQRKHIVDKLKKRPTSIEKTEDIVRYFLQHA
jgi:Holliday junction DNA helicase RuvA